MPPCGICHSWPATSLASRLRLSPADEDFAVAVDERDARAGTVGQVLVTASHSAHSASGVSRWPRAVAQRAPKREQGDAARFQAGAQRAMRSTLSGSAVATPIAAPWCARQRFQRGQRGVDRLRRRVGVDDCVGAGRRQAERRRAPAGEAPRRGAVVEIEQAARGDFGEDGESARASAVNLPPR